MSLFVAFMAAATLAVSKRNRQVHLYVSAIALTVSVVLIVLYFFKGV